MTTLNYPFRHGDTVNLIDEPTVDLIIQRFDRMFKDVGSGEWECIVIIKGDEWGRKYRIPAHRLRPSKSEVRKSLTVIQGGKP